MTITADHCCFYLASERFYPLIQEDSTPLQPWSSVAVIASGDLAAAHACVAAGKWILWDCCFPFTRNEAAFEEQVSAIDGFIQGPWSLFKQHTFGVILYRAGIDPMEQQYDAGDFQDWLFENQKVVAEESDRYLFAADVLGQYLHRLVSFLPDDLLPFACLDLSAIASPALAAQLVSSCRFQHLHLALKGIPLPCRGILWQEGSSIAGWLGQNLPEKVEHAERKVGVVLPSDSRATEAVFKELDQIFALLEARDIPYRILSETRLSEEWDGIDSLIVIEDSLSPLGQRKLKGFQAAGGMVSARKEWKIGSKEPENRQKLIIKTRS